MNCPKDWFNYYNKNKINIIKPIIPNVLNVTPIPSVLGVILAKRGSERKANKKKTAKARMPAPTGGDSSNGTRRLKL